MQTGKFRYIPAFEEETQEVYYYSDDYFSKSGKEYSYYAPYGLIQGDDQLIDLDDDFKDRLTVKTGGPLEKLVKVQVDGKDLSSANYELRSGSTILTLKEAYLKTLDAGTHTLKLVYIDSVIQAQFVIRKTQKQTPSDSRRYSIPLTGVES